MYDAFPLASTSNFEILKIGRQVRAGRPYASRHKNLGCTRITTRIITPVYQVKAKTLILINCIVVQQQSHFNRTLSESCICIDKTNDNKREARLHPSPADS